MISRRLSRSIAISATAIAVGGGVCGIVSAAPGADSRAAAAGCPEAPPGQGAPGCGGFGARSGPRSGPAAGGAAGTVDSVSASGFAISTSAGRTVAVETAVSTAYRNGTGPTSASVIAKGESVLVLGTVDFGTADGPTITASQVIVQTADGPRSATASAAGVVPFQRGAPSAPKQVGQIPAVYSQGSGTIVSGTEANEATEAALAAYPGGIVNRVVKLSDGEYEVHNIGVNWPHHIFVSQNFKFVGAD